MDLTKFHQEVAELPLLSGLPTSQSVDLDGFWDVQTNISLPQNPKVQEYRNPISSIKCKDGKRNELWKEETFE